MTFNSQENENTYIDNPEIAEMVLFLNPETVERLQFLDPNRSKNSGSRKCRNGVISGSRNRRKTEVSGTRNHKNGSEIVEMVDKSYINQNEASCNFLVALSFHPENLFKLFFLLSIKSVK